MPHAIKLAIFVALACGSLSAQTGLASISGLVTDPTGAVIPGVEISIRNNDTNVTRTTQSNAEGYYTMSNLIPGNYSIGAQFKGFKNLERSGIRLRVGDRLTVDLIMEVGAQTESVNVVGQVVTIRTEDVETGLVIDNKRIQELPQYNRNPLAFALLTPNVNGTAEQAGHDTDLRINGGRNAQAEYFIDGVPVTTGYRHDVPPSVPSREAVSEFKVITNGLSAEYGRLSGGAIQLITRSGTNRLHGSAYEFFRNDKLNANDWNSNRFGRGKGVFHDNVFGGTLGGPILIPKLYNGRDKTFFFINYEGTRRRTGSNAVLTGVPTALERQGDFSQSLIDRGAPVEIFDPLTARLEGGRVVRDPFPGNRIPAARFNPLSRIYLDYYPQPNRPPQPGSSHDQNFVGSVTNPLNNDRWTGRLDQNWSERHVTHFSLTRFSDDAISPRWLSALQPVTARYSTAHTISVEHTWTLSPTSLLNLRGGLVRATSFNESQVDVDGSAWPLQAEVINLLGTTRNRLPALNTGDTIFNLGGGSVNNVFETNYTGSVSFQKLWGRHSTKIGYEHRRYYSNVMSGGSFAVATQRSVTSRYFDQPTTGSPFAAWLLGVVTWGNGTQFAGPASLQTFHGAYVQHDVKLTPKLTVNAGLRWDFEPPRTERFDRQVYWDKSYQWPWKPNTGWSWERVLQQAGATMPQPEWLAKGIFGRVAMLGTKEYPSRHSQETYADHFAPRLGLAWSLLPRTVLRAGYGLNWLTTTGGVFLNGAPWNVGYGDFARLLQGGSPDGGLTFPLSFTVPMPGRTGYVPFTRDIEALNRSTMGQWFIANAFNQNAGYEHVLVFGLQREVGTGSNTWLLEAYYNGNLGRNLPFWLGTGEHILPNAYHILGPLGDKLNIRVDNPFYGQIPAATGMGGPQLQFGRMFQRNPLWFEIWTMGEPLGTSNYHSAYVQAEHRFAGGFSFLVNYTVSKHLQDVGGIDNQFAQGPSQQGFPQAGLPLKDIYGIAPTDMTHRALFNYLFDIPVGRGKRLLSDPQSMGEKALDKIIGGWQLAGTTTLWSGRPIMVFTPSGGVGGLGSQWYNIGHGRTSRPRFVVPRIPYDNHVDGHTALEGAAGFRHYMNPDSFRLVQGFEIGDVGSVLPDMRGPGFVQWDLAVMKNFYLPGEGRYFQLRGEAENVFNHMNPAMPNGAVTQRTFGMITGQQGAPRRIMIAAKLVF